MLYKRISNALCLAMCLSMTTTHSMVETKMPAFARATMETILKHTDPLAQRFHFHDTASLLKASASVVALLLLIVPFYRYLTSGKNFDAASSDEELAKAVKSVKQRVTVKTLHSLVRELYFKMVRAIRSKLGHHSYLITIKEEKTKNNDGTTNNVLELKTVGATGLCKHIEELAENVVVLRNIALGFGAIRNLSNGIHNGSIIEALMGTNLSWSKFHS